MGERRGAYRVLVGKREGKKLLGRPTHERIILKCSLSGSGMGEWTGLIWLRIRTRKGHL
jgi:hypothetical protein